MSNKLNNQPQRQPTPRIPDPAKTPNREQQQTEVPFREYDKGHDVEPKVPRQDAPKANR